MPTKVHRILEVLRKAVGAMKSDPCNKIYFSDMTDPLEPGGPNIIDDMPGQCEDFLYWEKLCVYHFCWKWKFQTEEKKDHNVALSAEVLQGLYQPM